MDVAALRLVEPDPQATFPWAEPGSRKLLAVAAADVERWRVKLNIKRITFIALNEEWSRDGRWQDLMERITAEGRVSVPSATGALLMVIFELLRNEKAMGLQAEDTRPIPNAMRTWGLRPDDERTLQYVADLAIKAKVLHLVDADDFAAHAKWPAYERPADPRGTARNGVKPRDAARNGVKPRDVDGRDETGPDLNRRDPAGPPEAPRERGGERAELVRMVLELAEAVRQKRREAGKPRWPTTTNDDTDLLRATTTACKANDVERLRMDLLEIAGWAATGGGFHAELEKRGWI